MVCRLQVAPLDVAQVGKPNQGIVGVPADEQAPEVIVLAAGEVCPVGGPGGRRRHPGPVEGAAGGDGGEEFPAMDGQRRLEVDPDRRRLRAPVHAPDDIASVISIYDVDLRYRRPIWMSCGSFSGGRCACTCCTMRRRARCTGPGSSKSAPGTATA